MTRKCFIPLGLAALAWAQAPLRDPTLDRVVAVVDGKNLTYGELQRIIESSPPALKQMFQTNPQSAIMQYHIMTFLGKEGERRKLDQRSPLKDELETMRYNILAGAVVNDERDSYPVSNEAIQEYYDQHSADFEQAVMKGIYISFKPQAAASTQDLAEAAQQALGQARSERSEAEARKLAESVVARARGGEDFVRLVEEFSEDRPSKLNRGDMGVLKSTSSYPPEFRAAVTKTKVGEVTDPIRVATGFYIIRVEERNLAPLTEVRGDIVQEIRQRHLDQWFNELNRRFYPDIKDPSILQPAPQPQKPPISLPGR
jgi:parvulin-like peptidyl-prolyl isomerase